MEQQASVLDKQLDKTVAEIKSVFDAMNRRGASFIERNFNVIKAVRGVNKDQLWKEFETDVIGNTMVDIRHISEQYANALVDNSRVYWRTVIERLNKMEALLRAEASTMDAAAYADQREALQEALSLADLELTSSADKRIVEGVQLDFESNIRNFSVSATSGVLGALAFIISIATPGALSAYPLATLGALVGGPIALIGGGFAYAAYRRSINGAKASSSIRSTTCRTTISSRFPT
jgi:hypothetical protein